MLWRGRWRGRGGWRLKKRKRSGFGLWGRCWLLFLLSRFMLLFFFWVGGVWGWGGIWGSCCFWGCICWVCCMLVVWVFWGWLCLRVMMMRRSMIWVCWGEGSCIFIWDSRMGCMVLRWRFCFVCWRRMWCILFICISSIYVRLLLRSCCCMRFWVWVIMWLGRGGWRRGGWSRCLGGCLMGLVCDEYFIFFVNII